MTVILPPAQLRILGVLLEKQFATPEYYPLTLNALVAGCNQKSNRDPVVHMDEPEVSKALRELCARDWTREVHDPSGRVPRYGHRINAVIGVDAAQSAILCELMLRGPQTPGELRGRASRLTRFDTLESVEEALAGLAGRDEPLVVQLERAPGARERRWAHLLGGAPAAEAAAGRAADAGGSGDRVAAGEAPSGGEGRDIGALEREVEDLRREVAELKAAFERFRRQFE
jgi:uncharacterized protein YceH (UPF0502 family)